MEIEPRHVGLLALLALVPVAIYTFGGGEPGTVSAIITAFNVCLIASSLFVGFGPASGETGSHETAS